MFQKIKVKKLIKEGKILLDSDEEAQAENPSDELLEKLVIFCYLFFHEFTLMFCYFQNVFTL